MPVMSQGWPAVQRFRIWNTASGLVQSLNSSPQPQASAISRKMWKSASASPGGRATFLIRPTRRSELMKVPSFSPQPADGSTRSASAAVSVVADMSCTTRKSRRALQTVANELRFSCLRIELHIASGVGEIKAAGLADFLIQIFATRNNVRNEIANAIVVFCQVEPVYF